LRHSGGRIIGRTAGRSPQTAALAENSCLNGRSLPKPALAENAILAENAAFWQRTSSLRGPNHRQNRRAFAADGGFGRELLSKRAFSAKAGFGRERHLGRKRRVLAENFVTPGAESSAEPPGVRRRRRLWQRTPV